MEAANRCAEAPRGTYGDYRNVFYWCPGCKERHNIRVREEGVPRPSWNWNGSLTAPTFEPSVHYVDRCHHHVREGKIEYCNDCIHDLKGQTVDLPPVDEEGYKLDAPTSE